MVRISDEDILKILLNNAKIKNTEIARKLNVSEGAIRKRIKKLEEEGIIKGYSAKVNIKKLGYNIDTIIGIDTTPEGFLYVLNKLKENPKVLQLWTSTGDHMIMFRAWFKDNEELTNFVRKINKMKEVTKTCPAILIEEIK